jgi:hypothetical protein
MFSIKDWPKQGRYEYASRLTLFITSEMWRSFANYEFIKLTNRKQPGFGNDFFFHIQTSFRKNTYWMFSCLENILYFLVFVIGKVLTSHFHNLQINFVHHATKSETKKCILFNISIIQKILLFGTQNIIRNFIKINYYIE